MSKENREANKALLNVNDPNPEDNQKESPLVQELQSQLQVQAAQLEALQTQLKQNSNEDQRKAQEADQALADAEAAKLANEADLKNALSDVTDQDRIESLTNKELINVMVDAIEKSSDARTKQIESAVSGNITEVRQQVALTQKAIVKLATAIDVKDVKNQNPELNKYDQDAAEIMQGNPGMSVADAYLLAKAKAASKEPDAKNTARERPDSTTSRSGNDRVAEAEERREKQRASASENRQGRSGVRGIRSIIDAGVDRVLSARG